MLIFSNCYNYYFLLLVDLPLLPLLLSSYLRRLSLPLPSKERLARKNWIWLWIQAVTLSELVNNFALAQWLIFQLRPVLYKKPSRSGREILDSVMIDNNSDGESEKSQVKLSDDNFFSKYVLILQASLTVANISLRTSSNPSSSGPKKR